MPKILYSDYYLPNNWISARDAILASRNLDIPKGYDTAEDFCEDFQDRNKLEKIFVEYQRTPIDIFEQLLQRMFEITEITPDQIGFIFYTNPLDLITNDNVSIPYYLINKFKMENASVLTLDQKCATSLMTLGVAHTLLSKKKEKYALILTSCFMKEMENRYIQFTICGDGAGVFLVKDDTKSEGFEIVDFESISDGFYSFHLQQTINSENEFLDPGADDRIHFIEKGMSVINKLLIANDVSPSQVKLIIPQSVSHYVYFIYSKILNYPFENIFTSNISNGGHLGDVDTVRNITDVLENYTFMTGDYVVLYAVGSDGTDMNYTALLLQYKCHEN